MKLENLRSLIRESVHDYIREIDEAAKVGAIKASIAKCEEAIGIRERKMNMEGLDEAYHDMLDKSKMAELKSEIKALTKSLEKYKKQLAKLEKVDEVKDDVVTDSEVEEVVTDETMTEEAPIDETDVMAEMDVEETAINESFLKMQKLAGVITEAQYNQKKREALNEGEYSDWWTKANDELRLDFDDDIYSYVDSYDEPWQGKFADEVVNINATDYEDFKKQVKKLYNEINPF